MARTCKGNNDCPQGKKCVSGWCGDAGQDGSTTYTCYGNDTHCPANMTCQQGTCVANQQQTPSPKTCPTGYSLDDQSGMCLQDPVAAPPPATVPDSPPASAPASATHQPPKDLGDGCYQVCGPDIQSYQDRATAIQAVIDQDKAAFQAQSDAYAAQTQTQNARIAAAIPRYQAPAPPSAPGGYLPGGYGGGNPNPPAPGTTQGGGPTATPGPPTTPGPVTPPPPPPDPCAGLTGMARLHCQMQNGQAGVGIYGTRTGGTTPATPTAATTYSPGAGYTSWQDYQKQYGQGE